MSMYPVPYGAIVVNGVNYIYNELLFMLVAIVLFEEPI